MKDSESKKSDVKAKEAYKEKLKLLGYTDIATIASAADIRAKKNGEIYYFEIKMTRQKETYFAAATLTEWVEAMKTPDKYKFVIAQTDDGETFVFTEYTPLEFMEFSTIPPFKIFFNLNLVGKKKH